MGGRNLKDMTDVAIYNMALVEAVNQGYTLSSGKTSEIYHNLIKYREQFKSEPQLAEDGRHTSKKNLQK